MHARQLKNFALLFAAFVLPIVPALLLVEVGLRQGVPILAYVTFFAGLLVFFLNQRCPSCRRPFHMGPKGSGYLDLRVPAECPGCHAQLL